MNEKLTVTLPAELVAVIQEQVDSGRYDTISDVVRDALERVEYDQGLSEATLEHMRAKTRQSLANPDPSYTVEETRKHMEDYIAQIYQKR